MWPIEIEWWRAYYYTTHIEHNIYKQYEFLNLYVQSATCGNIKLCNNFNAVADVCFFFLLNNINISTYLS